MNRKSNALNFQLQFSIPGAEDYAAGDDQQYWCFDQGSSSRHLRTTTGAVGRKEERKQRELERDLVKVRKEWRKVKEEIGFVKQRGVHLRETVLATDRKIEVMLLELERAEKDVRDLMVAHGDRNIM